MTGKNASVKVKILYFLLVFLAIVVSIRYLDAKIAVAVMEFLRSIRPLRKATEDIPDLLPHFVFIGTIIMWAVYLYRSHKKKYDTETLFLRFAGTVLPIAYVVKTLTKIIFGRTGPRGWLRHNEPLSFHWFSRWSSSFPSGHMIVLTALAAAVLIYYPKYRKPVIALIILLAAALIGSDYHFLSDVIAGAYVGVATTYALKYVFEKIKFL